MKLFSKKTAGEANTFWDHLEVLRWVLLRVLAVLVLLVTVLFGNRDFLFDDIIFPPLRSDFIVYQLFCRMGEWLNMPGLCPGDFSIQLINIQLSGQFMAHISTAFTIALVLSVPYLLYECWRFVAPALYPAERRNVGLVFFISSFLFYLGVVVSYFLVFPLTIRFLGTYNVSALVPNQISIQSYLDTLYILIFSMGIMFEMPVLAYFLSRMGIVTRQMLQSVRRYAFVAILVLAAIITPTTDPFTMLVVAMPLYLLYEVSILVCRKKKNE